MRILAYIMISTNRIFESAHGPEIPNFLEIVAGIYSIGLPRRLVRSQQSCMYILIMFSLATPVDMFDTSV